MADCARIAACPLFKQFSMKSSLAVWQNYYCKGAFDRCERLKRVQCGTAVPSNLLPNGRTLEVPLEQLEHEHML